MTPPDELERLRAETVTLNEQVKLLVRTEQRLARSQTALDRQAERLAALSAFSLWCDRATSQRDILEQALLLLEDVYTIDESLAGDVSAGSLCTYDGAVRPLSMAVAQALAAVCGVVALEGDAAGDMARAVGLTSTPDVLFLVVLRQQDEPCGLIVLSRRSGSTSFHKDDLSAQQVPFIQLVAAHADRAAHALRLHAELRARSDELARANLELTASMERLAQAQKLEAIGRLAGGIAHDFNNLLTAIMGNAELICTATVPGAGPHDDAVQILETCRRAGEITQQLLAFGRKSQRHSTLVDLNQVAVDLTRMLGRLIGERIQLRLALDPSLDLVLVDRGHVEQVILNLVVNARDAMPEGGDCTIETRPAMREDLLAAGIRDGAGWVSLSVVDEGVGMTDDVRGQVFEPFFTTKPPGQGTGLGLATVHGLVAANGGQIVVHSAPGRGSRFTVLFPVAGTRASADRTVPGVATVLVVDDDEPIRRIVRRVLTNAGYRVLDADGGERALAVAEAEPTIDLLITDVVMPVIGGVELAGRMRGLLPSLPVVFISGYTFERLGEQSLGPADHFLSKPFTPRALVDQVQRVLRERASVSSVS